MKDKQDQVFLSDKEYRRKLYEENKRQYKKEKANFTYGISSNFRLINKNKKIEWNELEEETLQLCEERE